MKLMFKILYLTVLQSVAYWKVMKHPEAIHVSKTVQVSAQHFLFDDLIVLDLKLLLKIELGVPINTQKQLQFSG